MAFLWGLDDTQQYYSFQPSPPVDPNEGSGDSYNNFADEDEDDSNFNYDYEGSGNDDEEDAIEDSYSPRQPTDNFQNSRNNYQDPYNTGGNSWNPDPRDPWDAPSNQNNFNTNQQQNNNNFNSQYSPTQQVCFHTFCIFLTKKFETFQTISASKG